MGSFAPPRLLTSPISPPPAVDPARIGAALAAIPLPHGFDGPAIAGYVQAVRDEALALQRSTGSAAPAEALLVGGYDRLLSRLFESLGGSDSGGLSLSAAGLYAEGQPGLHSRLELLLLSSKETVEAEARLREGLGRALESASLSHRLWAGTPESLVQVVVESDDARRALLASRPIAGDAAQLDRFRQTLRSSVLDRLADELVATRLQALRARRLQHGRSVYLLEPELEAGQGGLRDLEAALWICAVRLERTGLEAMAEAGALDAQQLDELRWARDLLARVRNELQALTGGDRASLEFAVQAELASRLGFTGKGLAPIERLMKGLHLAAAIVARGSDRLLERAQQNARRLPAADRRLDNAFAVSGGALALADPSLLDRTPELLVRAFAQADREGTPLGEAAREQITQRLDRIDASLRSHPQVLATLRQMFLRPGTRGEFLEAMHESGVLGALFPELGRITALYRQDAMHAYTVDVHSIVAVRRLYALRNGELLEKEPGLTRLAHALPRPLPLFLAALFHDCGRSSDAGHSQRGARLMRQVADRLGLATRDAQDAEFLVRNHLLMSHVSQRRDLSDPQAIESFARGCGDAERLLMLYLLTWADLSASSPKVWNDWRARLVGELYEKSLAFLEGRYGGTPDHLQQLRERMRKELLAHFPEAQVESFLERMPERYFRTAAPDDAVRHFRVLRRARKSSLAAWLRHRQTYTELTLCARDVPGVLSVFTGVLSAHGIDILRAQLFTTADARVVAVFVVQEAGGSRIDRARWKPARADLVSALAGGLDAEALLRERAGAAPPPAFSPPLKTRVELDPASASEATIVDLVAEDRPGLLHDVSRALFEAGTSITVAKISTEAGRAIDSFYVQKDGQKVDDPELLDRIEDAVLRALEGPR